MMSYTIVLVELRKEADESLLPTSISFDPNSSWIRSFFGKWVAVSGLRDVQTDNVSN